MSNLYKYLLLFCIFCNFFSDSVLKWLGWWERDTTLLYDFVPDSFFVEAEKELVYVFLVLIIISFYRKGNGRGDFSVSQYQNEFYRNSFFNFLVWFVFVFFVAYVFSKINWSFSTEFRGVGQFKLANRQKLLTGMCYNFYLPFLLYLYLIGFFKKNKWFFFSLAMAVFILNGVASGGRHKLISSMLFGVLFVTYLEKINKKTLIFASIVAIVALSFTATDRFNVNRSFWADNIVKVLQSNSSSVFLPVVKYSIDQGYILTPSNFGMHFVSVFMPSFIYINVFHMISYTRSSFLYNSLYNTNPNSGLGFMMLADFYWCFKYWGYVLYVLVYFFVLNFFRKYIFSDKPVLVVMSIYIIYRFCDQRADFGAFVKPVVYTFVFLSFLEFFRLKALKAK